MEPSVPPTQPPIPPVTEAPTLPPVVPAPPKSHLGLLISVLVILALVVVGYFAYPYLSSIYPKSPVSSPGSIATPSPTLAPISAYPPVENAQNSLVYIRMPNPKQPSQLQAWLIDPATGKEQVLSLKNFAEVYKYYGSSQLFYKPIGDKGEFRILDLTTGTEQSYILITHPDPSVREGVNVNNISEISPDGKYLVFQASFDLPCPSPSPFPSGFERGFGPCGPDESLEAPTGYYLYDFSARKSTYLGGAQIRVSRWDPSSLKLYYIDYGQGNTTKALDLTTKTITFVDSTPNFGYFTYPLLLSHQLIRQEGATGTSGTPAFSKISLLDLNTQKSTDIDNTTDWVIIQPFIFSSPDDQNIIYVRTGLVGDGIRRFSLYRYSLADKKSTDLTPGDNTANYSVYADWIDSHTFVTSVNTIKTPYSNASNYLVKIDVTTGKITRLTPQDIVYRFNTQ